ncbi:hypothetical protein LguiA_035336 [Lonicera macranthoides]
MEECQAKADCDIDVLGDITIPDPAILGKPVHTIFGAKNILEMPLLTVQVNKVQMRRICTRNENQPLHDLRNIGNGVCKFMGRNS